MVSLAGGSLNFDGPVLAPFRYADKIYFTAAVPTKRGTGKVSRVFSTTHGKPAQMLAINPKEDDTHAAHATLNATADRLYYTVFKEVPLGKQGQSEIWYREKRYDGTWGNIIQLPKHINQQGTVNTQPACGYDFLLKKDVLFFASNRPGGMGGFDIWYCTVERNGTFGDPVNMPSNAPGDDLTPHFYSQEQTLFFSSYSYNGKVGFDIYFTKKNATGEWQAPMGLDQLNTSFDELYFSYHQPSQTSYFCSNRPNENCQNAPMGCSDFSVFTAKLGGSLSVSILSGLDSTALYGCNIELQDASTGLIEKCVLKSEESTLQFSISPEKKYRLIVSHEGFLPVFLDLEQSSSDFCQPLTMQVLLMPMRH